MATKYPKTTGKNPAFLFYYKDWLTDHRLNIITKAEKGVWIDLIAISMTMPKPGCFYDSKRNLNGKEIVSMLRGNSKSNRRWFDKLVEHDILKQDETGMFYVKRIKRDTELQAIRRKAGLMGGNPILLNQPQGKNNSGVLNHSLETANETEDGLLNKSNEGGVSYSMQEVIDRGALIGYTEIEAVKFYHHYNGQNWKKGNNQPISNLESVMTEWRNNKHKFAGGKKEMSRAEIEQAVEQGFEDARKRSADL
jgi:hypothetical protein